MEHTGVVINGLNRTTTLLGASAVASVSLIAVALAARPCAAADTAIAPANVASCAGCHGTDGGGRAAAGIPRLAGLNAAYLQAQLAAFKSGTRANATMSAIAAPMNAAAMANLAAYYASLAVPQVPPAATSEPQVAAGAALALRGDWGAKIPPCAACHGKDGRGVGSAFPAIAGQSAAYVTVELKAWQAGPRHDDPLGLMRTVVARLDDMQIAAVAAYYAALPAAPTLAATGPTVAPSPESAIPNDEFGRVVKRGEAIFRETSAQAGPYVGNSLACANCHLDGGRLANSAPLAQAYVAYPAYRAKNGHVNTYAERLQGCFRYSMNGKAPPLGDPVLVALEAYSFFLAKGAPTGEELPGRGYPKLPSAAQPLDFARGGQVFAAKCAICHGADGHGQTADGATVFPALWGPNSFNWGAGMASIKNAAGFVKANMPFGQGGSLSDQEAWDVAMYMDGHERPQDPRFTVDVATTRQKFHDTSDSLYGTSVAGVLLGERAPPAGPRPRTP